MLRSEIEPFVLEDATLDCFVDVVLLRELSAREPLGGNDELCDITFLFF